MAAQEDATPWEPPLISAIPNPADSTTSSTKFPVPSEPILYGRSYFSHLGLVRRKPSRPDAPPTLSKSCSDKLALKQSTSLLSSLTSLLISPSNAYLSSITLPLSQYSSTACLRSFSPTGRLAPLSQSFQDGKRWQGGYSFHPYTIKTTTHEFPYSRRQVLKAGEQLVPTNISTSHTPIFTQTLISGTLQGRRQFTPLGAAHTSKLQLWNLCLSIATLIAVPQIELALKSSTYKEIKEGHLLEGRRNVKQDVREVLGGWVRNEGGEDFGRGSD